MIVAAAAGVAGQEGAKRDEGQSEPKQALAVLSVPQETDDDEPAPVLLPASDGRLDALAAARWVLRWPGSPGNMGRGPTLVGPPRPDVVGSLFSESDDGALGTDRRSGSVGVADGATLSGAGGLAEAIDYWAAYYEVDATLMHAIARCESTYGEDPNAYNGASGHWGPFQYNMTTWLGTPPGQRGDSPNDPWASAEATAWMISQGRRGEWSC